MKYIALLRGVNVGGKKPVSMDIIKKSLTDAGFKNVRTYINSGNVIFDMDEQPREILARRLEQIIESVTGVFAAVSVIKADELKKAIDEAPGWWGDEPDVKHNAIFIIPPASAQEIAEEVGDIKPEYEKIHFAGDIIFWSAPLKTFSRTKWSKVSGTKAYKSITIRNANTTRKISALASE